MLLRPLRRALLAIAIVSVISLIVRRSLQARQVSSAVPPAEAQPSLQPLVTPAEREAAWAALAAHRLAERRLAEAIEALDAAGEAREHVIAVEDQLALARRLLASHTATLNENLRLRGSAEALTAALVAMRETDTQSADPEAIAALEEELEALRSELLAMELQVKELAEERDRAVDDADELRAALEGAPSTDDDALRRLRLEIGHVRRSLEIERQRNLRLGRRGRTGFPL